MGQTLDDTAGEAFDKVAKVLGLGYPGGAVIENMANKGDKQRIGFPKAYLSNDSLDFSFSGLKTSVALYVKKWRTGSLQDEVTIADIAASFQESVVDVLTHKTMLAREKAETFSVVVTGGVACNNRLRNRLSEAASKKDIRVYYPRPEFCTDNGAMIAIAGYHRLLNGEKAKLSIDVKSRYPISDLVHAVSG